jgi:hypothetical protein
VVLPRGGQCVCVYLREEEEEEGGDKTTTLTIKSIQQCNVVNAPEETGARGQAKTEERLESRSEKSNPTDFSPWRRTRSFFISATYLDSRARVF